MWALIYILMTSDGNVTTSNYGNFETEEECWEIVEYFWANFNEDQEYGFFDFTCLIPKYTFEEEA